MKAIVDVINDFKQQLNQLNYPVYTEKLNNIIDKPHIVILESRRQPVYNDSIDKVYDSTIEVTFITNKLPVNFIELYNVRDSIINALNNYQFIVSELEVDVNRKSNIKAAIHMLFTVKTR